jgi:hypothetical protein
MEFIPKTTREKKGYQCPTRTQLRIIIQYDNIVQSAVKEMPNKHHMVQVLSWILESGLQEFSESKSKLEYFLSELQEHTNVHELNQIASYFMCNNEFLEHLETFIFNQSEEFFTCPEHCSSVYMALQNVKY